MVSLIISAGAVYPQSQIRVFTEDGRERTDAIMTEAEPIDTPGFFRKAFCSVICPAFYILAFPDTKGNDLVGTFPVAALIDYKKVDMIFPAEAKRSQTIPEKSSMISMKKEHKRCIRTKQIKSAAQRQTIL